jgi:hypothetical protein
MSLKSTYNDLPKWAKGVTAIVVIAGGAFVVVKSASVIKKFIADAPLRRENRDWKQENAGAGWSNATKQTLTDAQLGAMANKIHTSMHGCGTYENEIVAEFQKLKTDGDFTGLQKAYGSRRLSCMGIGDNYTLTAALASEMSTYWIDLINSNLAIKGIKYTV